MTNTREIKLRSYVPLHAIFKFPFLKDHNEDTTEKTFAACGIKGVNSEEIITLFLVPG